MPELQHVNNLVLNAELAWQRVSLEFLELYPSKARLTLYTRAADCQQVSAEFRTPQRFFGDSGAMHCKLKANAGSALYFQAHLRAESSNRVTKEYQGPWDLDNSGATRHGSHTKSHNSPHPPALSAVLPNNQF